ncbi:MAG: hypothetical protein C4534_04260 [Gaiellales bacterium]|nr:MAG: hypothetical protein C4534_04260 [Gaiellales bacterium]
MGALLLVVSLVVSLGASAGVGQDGYGIAGITIGPSSRACIGGTITLSGSGAPASSPITVGMNYKVPGMWPSAHLGDTMSDGAGSWSLTATVPYTAMNANETTTATPAGEWEVVGLSTGYTAVGDLTVVDCSKALPATGAPQAPTVLALALAVLAAGGFSISVWRHRSRA